MSESECEGPSNPHACCYTSRLCGLGKFLRLYVDKCTFELQFDSKVLYNIRCEDFMYFLTFKMFSTFCKLCVVKSISFKCINVY